LPDYDQAMPSVVGITNETAEGVTVKGLQTEQEYCFVAKAYATSPADPDAPDGRTHASQKLVCATPQYAAPGFNGIEAACRNKTSTSFTVDWDVPNPQGIFSFYEVFYKKSSTGIFDFNEAIQDHESGDIGSGDSDYGRLTVNSQATQVSMTSLLPNTQYLIGMRTYFQNPDTQQVFRDTNLVSTNCKTEPAKVEHQGWEELFAVGPKINGLSVPPSPMLERIPLPGVGDVEEKGVDNIWNHRYPQEYPFGLQGVNASSQGIIRLHWKDMVLSAGLGTMYDFNGPNSGYKVYRKLYKPSHDQVPPTLVGDVSEGPWVELTSDPVAAKREVRNSSWYYFGEYVDYGVDRVGLADNETRVYWYKVEAYINGVKVNFETIPADGIVKMILPPNNMSLMHRWMANKDFCGKIQRPPLRAQNYKCQYNGLASTNGYYDMGNHVLIDRFLLGCNFTRGDSVKKCTSTSSIFRGTGDANNPGTLEGDCIAGDSNWGYPNSFADAEIGAVMFSARSSFRRCVVKVSEGVSGWDELRYLDYRSAGSNWDAISPATKP